MLAIEELAECTPSGFDTQGTVEAKELAQYINKFLEGLSPREQNLFVARYWYVLPVADIAERLDMRPGAVKTALHRLRKKLLDELRKEGFA